MSEALDHEAPLSLPTSDNPIVAAAMAYTKEHLDSVTADEVSRAVSVSERTLRRLFQDTLGLSWRTYLLHARMLRAMALLAAPGAVGAGDRDRRRLRQPQLVHAGLHAVLRRDTVDVPQKGWRRADLIGSTPLRLIRSVGIVVSKLPVAQ